MAQNPSNVIPDQLIVVEGDAGFVPKSEPSDAGKVLKVDAQGTPVWGEDSGGTVFEPDKGLQLVDGKLSVKTGNYGITNNMNGEGIVGIVVANGTLTVDNAGVCVTNPLPASTSSDAGKALVVNSSGNAVWGDAPAGTVKFDWSTVTRADVDNALAAGKSPVILYTLGTQVIECPLQQIVDRVAGFPDYYFVSTPTNYVDVPYSQSMSVYNLVIFDDGQKSYSVRSLSASVSSSDGSLTLARGASSTTLDLSVANPLPASTSAEANKVLTVNSSGVPVWADAQGGGGGGGSREYKPKIDDSELVPRSIVFKMYGYVEQSMDPETWSYIYNFTPSTTLPLQSPFSPYVPSGHDRLFDLDVLDSSNGIYRIRWKVNSNIWNHDNHDSNFIPLDEMLSVQLCDSSGSVKAVVEVYGVDLTGVTDAGGFFYNSWYFGDMNIKNASSVTNMEGFNRGFDELKYYLPSAGLPVDDTYFIFPTDLSSCTNMTNAFSSFGFGDNAMQLYSGPIPDFKLGSGLVNVNYAFANQKNLSEGILAQYTRMASLSNINSHTGTFMNCGTNKSTTGVVQLSQIPSSWGGTGT